MNYKIKLKKIDVYARVFTVFGFYTNESMTEVSL